MNGTSFFIALSGLAVLVLSAATVATNAAAQSPGEATPEQIQSCVDAAAEDLGVPEGEVRAYSSTVGSDGEVTVQLEVHGDGATCTISPSGHAEVSYG